LSSHRLCVHQRVRRAP